MRRRDFIRLAGGAAVTWPLRAHAQQGSASRIAVVHPSNPLHVLGATGGNASWRAFFAGLAELGFSEDKNLVVQRYSGEGRTDHYGELAKEIVRHRPDAIFAVSSRLVEEFKRASQTIPIVGVTADPLARGITTSLARPAGNVTGIVVDAGIQIWEKRLSLLHDVMHTSGSIGFLAPTGVVEGPQGRALRDASQRIGVVLVMGALESPIGTPEYARVFALLERQQVRGLLVSDAPENFTHRLFILELAGKARLPTIYPYREFTEAGGLLAYGVDIVPLYARAAGYVAQILKGASPADIPFFQAAKFELVINLKAAKELGVTMPATLLARADEVIE